MEEPYIEGVATHDGPESCVRVREGAGEALTGARAGWAIEPRNYSCPGCRRRSLRRKATPSPALVASRRRTPRGRGTCACARGSMRENREIPWSPNAVDDAPPGADRGVAYRGAGGREGNAEAGSP